MIDKYAHPFFMLRLANILFILKSPTMAIQLCIKVCFFLLFHRNHSVLIDPIVDFKAQQLARGVGIIDPQLDEFIEKEEPAITASVEELRSKAEKGGICHLKFHRFANLSLDSYYQIWKPTKEHRFPFNLPVPPDGYNELRNDWAKLRSSDDTLFDKYLLKLSIETNRLDTVFLLTERVSTPFYTVCG